ncbi:glutathione S-transferase [Artemisia annua]|uniref:Glutathione S-transferase n=1 Tax=Artemisia annua TaxID=35608 RepID=A0A2U1QAE6_ARTAN|nr:glutathione S-transferase [Artemisia annua]
MPTSTSVQEEVLPPALDSTSHPPPVFDGTTRYSYMLYQTGLYETIKLVPIDLKNRPDWYKEKVYPPNKVPALEHNNEVKGESLDLIKYIDANFEGPSLYPDVPALEHNNEVKGESLDLIKYIDANFEGPSLYPDALSKFDDGPFFLGQFSLVDIAYAPFIERFQPYLLEVKKYDIKVGRPKLAAWFEEMNKNDDFNQTRRDPKELVESYKKHFHKKPRTDQAIKFQTFFNKP